ncbi:hypothetical protein BCD67_17930 [Oscillatoriales cyanobacterium USR001]|nr:hypothetical protein BCD67_17930 [Oscillatoriales cyanobacterium USR001]
MASIGDIVFLGYNGVANPEGFSFVVKNALPANDIIKFTDNAINTAAANIFRTGEYAIQWNVPAAGVAAGTVVVITNWGATSAISFNDSSGGSITSLAIVGTLTAPIELQTNPGLNNAGDQIFAYTGTLTSPTILAGLDASTSPITTGTPNTQTTYAPLAGVPFTDLVAGVNGKTTFTTNPGAQSIANLTNPANFTTQTTLYTLTDITSAPPISTVNLLVSSNSGTEAAQTAITVTATASSAVSGNQTVDLAVTGTGITAGDYTLSGTTITILNGQTTGTATFTVVDDASVEGAETATLTLSNPSAGMTLGTTTTQNVTIADNDSPGVTITESAGSTNVTEGGATDTYTVVLNTQPTANVTIAINSGTQTSTNTNSLTFTTANWNTAQTVTVTAVDDVTAEGNHTQAISHTATSSDSNYNGITINSVTANITDNDAFNTPPTISGNTTTPFVNLPGTGPGYVGGVINDPTDPAKNIGINFTIGDDLTNPNNLTLTATSSNTSIVPNANLVLSGTGANRNLKITPAAAGYADITVNVNDGTNTTPYIVKYAASAAATTPNTTQFHTGTSDASTAIAIDSNLMLVGDDEDQTIRLYDRNNSGLPLKTFDFTSNLALTQLSGGIPREVDIEASTRSGDRIYWLGSHSNASSGSSRPNRYRVFATDISGSGSATNLNFVGKYDNLRTDLLNWDSTNVHGKGANYYGFTASAASGIIPESTDGSGFNIEGLTLAPNGTTAYLGFRAPISPANNRTKALIVPVTNFTSLVTGAASTATFGAPIELDLGGRGIRSIDRNANNQYVIIAGPADSDTGTPPKDFRLYTWTGNASDAPQVRSANLTALNSKGSFESIVEVPSNLTETSSIELLVDNGDTVWYGDNVISKELTQDNFQKFRSDTVILGAAPTRIREIQGASHTSPLATKTVSNVPGIVTGIIATGSGRGFYMQDPTPDTGPNPDATSEGIFVFLGSSTIPNPKVGDSVQVSGRVDEFRRGGSPTNLTITQINATVTGSSVQSIPSLGTITPTVIGNGGRTQPTTFIQNDFTPAAPGNVETGGDFDPKTEGIDFYESLEGMLVKVNDALTVGPTDFRGEFYVVPDNGKNATGITPRGGIVISPTDFNPERIQVDDTLLNPVGSAVLSPNVNVGDKISSITGIIDYNFSSFELLPTTQIPQSSVTSGGLQKEVTTLTGSTEKLTVANFNVENLDTNDGDGDTDVADGKFTALASRIVNNLKSPDILNIEEIQDNTGSKDDGVVDAEVTYNTLIAAIKSAGGPTYQFRQINPENNKDGGQPGANIRVGFLFNPSRVSFVDRAGGGSTTSTTVNNVNGEPELSASPGRIDPTNAAFNTSRKPLVGEFIFNDQKVFIVANHFNSKGGDLPLYGPTQPPDLTTEAQRRQQAQIVNDFVDSLLAVDPKANVIVAGDLNDFQFSEPLNIVRGIPGGSGTPILNNLIETLPENERYTYDFQGNAQVLDHILASDALFKNLDSFDVVHINSEFVEQDSDHDPSVARFNISLPTVSIAATDATAAETGKDPATFRITRSGSTSQELTVKYELSTGANQATNGIDYTPELSGTVTIPVGKAFADITITPVDDSLSEGSEAVTLNLVSNSDYKLDTNTSAIATIADNDIIGITVSQTSVDVAEGGINASYTISLKSQPTAPVTIAVTPLNNQVSVGLAAGSAIALAFTPNNWNVPQKVNVTAVDDTLIEGNHVSSILHSVSSNDSNYNIPKADGVTVNITDNEVASLSLSVKPESFSEGAGQNAATATVTRSGNISSAVTINLSSSDITEATVPQTVEISIGQNSVTFPVSAVDDTIVDGTQTVKLTASATNFSSVSAEIKVTDNDSNVPLPTNNDDCDRAFIFSPSLDKLINGSVNNDVIFGKENIDIIDGKEGNDIIFGGKDNDSLHGNDGSDILFGNLGDDYMGGGKNDDLLFGGKGNDLMFGSQGNDELHGDVGDDELYGGEGSDKLYGREGNDSLCGGPGNDFLYGGKDSDLVQGGAGNDELYGDESSDTLIGGSGNDTLTGGKGRDYFTYSNIAQSGDIITDFVAGNSGDILDLKALLTGLGYTGANPITDGYVKLSQLGANASVEIDPDGAIGSQIAVQLVRLDNVLVASLNSNNFRF